MKLKEGMVIHCNTRKKALEFLKECYKQGIYLADGCPIGDAIYEWYDFKQDTCYLLELRDDKIIIRYANKKYYMNKGHTIIDFDDLFDEKKKKECKVYEMPEYVGNKVKKVIINEPCVIVILNSGEKGIAKCCPEDEFNEERGYKIALERAMKEEYLNAVVRQDTIINQWIKIFENEDKYKDLIF